MTANGITKYPRSEMDLTWMDQAACRGYPTHIFFPERGESQDAAKAVCAGWWSQRERRNRRWPSQR